MKEELKNEIRNYVKINNLNASQADKLIDIKWNIPSCIYN